MTKLKLGIISAIAVVGVATPLVIQYREQARLRDENASLRQQIAEQSQLAQENQRLSKQLAEVKRSGSLTDEQRSELLRLRGEIGALRNQKSPSAQSRQTAAPSSRNPLRSPTIALLPADSWANVGTATPEAGWQTLRWAFIKHETTAFAQAVSWDPDVKAQATDVFNAAPESARQKFGSVEGALYAMMVTPGFSEQDITGFGIVSQSISGDDATLTVQEQHDDGGVRETEIPMHHFDDGWRVLTPPKMVQILGKYLNNPDAGLAGSTGGK